jgi:hypothetical protein
VADGHLAIERGTAEHPDAIVSSTPDTIASLVYEGADLAEALSAGSLTVEGDAGAVERFFTLFSLPAPADAPECQPAVGAPVTELLADPQRAGIPYRAAYRRN